MNLKFYEKVFYEAKHYPLKLENKNYAPICSGVYLITEILLGEEIIVYIGSTKSFRSRFFSHSVINKIKRIGNFGNIYVIPMRLEDYKQEEIDFISRICPKYNKNSTYRGVYKFLK
jgi:hypothetical protein